MERNFIEFWRNFFEKADESRKSMDAFSTWMRQSVAGLEQMTAAFQKSFGMDTAGKSAPDYFQVWKKALEDLQKSYAACLAMMGAIPREDHLALVRKYEELKEQLSSQKETIENLRMLLAEEKKSEHSEMTGQVQELVEIQARQFQKIMENFNQNLMNMTPTAEAASAESTETISPVSEKAMGEAAGQEPAEAVPPKRPSRKKKQ